MDGNTGMEKVFFFNERAMTPTELTSMEKCCPANAPSPRRALTLHALLTHTTLQQTVAAESVTMM
eukprot:76296-Prorocentrum_lima.AAC.1